MEFLTLGYGLRIALRVSATCPSKETQLKSWTRTWACTCREGVVSCLCLARLGYRYLRPVTCPCFLGFNKNNRISCNVMGSLQIGA